MSYVQSPDGGVSNKVTHIDSLIQLPTERQSVLSKPTRMFNAVSVAVSATTASTVVSSEGFDTLCINTVSGTALIWQVSIEWLFTEGGGVCGIDFSPANATNHKTLEVGVKAPFFRVRINNTDTTSAQTFTSYSYLKA